MQDSIEENNGDVIELIPSFSSLVLISVFNLMFGVFVHIMTTMYVYDLHTSSNQQGVVVVASALLGSLIINVLYFTNNSIRGYIFRYPFILPTINIICFLFCSLSRYDSTGIIPYSVLLVAFTVVFSWSLLLYI